ncbi:DELTA-stichotoxin-Hcr4a-like [Acanthochromis polyacanthus]|uniref:DELTA-stichotoxin-Hcr4a-like n=1 Tax=Acanthochromis polyacanthus TaxID=80966 RepID=A0A3Q1H373_9TELE|nr:DELTA-stichotoxin-Hcr4a-like [Acanthochromis polyacanthus]
MSDSAEALAASQTSRRNITIEITNLTNNYCLIDPKVYLDSGDVHSPPQPTIRPQMTKLCNFDKIKSKSTGAVGVLTYDLFERQSNSAREKVAIMFSVPFDYNFYKNWFALGLYPKDTECDEKLYKDMYNNKEPKAFVRQESNGSGLTFEGSSLDIKGTMSPTGRCIMKVEIWDKIFSPGMHQQY